MEENARQDYLQSRPRHPQMRQRDCARRSDEASIPRETQRSPNAIVSNFEGASPNLQSSADLWKEADEEKEQLFSMMEKVREKLMKRKNAADSQTLADVDLRNCKWEEVMSEVQATGTRWRTSAIKSTKTAQYIDKVGQNSKAFESWLGLLPAGDYGSSIAGVFKVVIGAAGRYTKIEETVFEALSEIPEIMEDARRYVQIYYENRYASLERKTFGLFRAILRALLHIMKFFADSKVRKIWQPLLHQNAYKSELVDSIDEIKKQTARVREEANQCLAERALVNERISLATNQNSETQLLNQETELHLLRNIYQMLKENPLLGLAQKDGLLHPNLSLLMNMTAPTREQPRTPSLDDMASLRARLLDTVNYDPEAIANDIQTTIQRGLALDEQPKAVAASLVTHPRFDAYFGPAAGADGGDEPSSSALLVNGRMDVAGSDGVSPLGLVIAEVARASMGRRGAYVVSHFCERHRPGSFASSTSSSTAAITPVSAMVASFIGQLLVQMEEQQVAPDFTFLKEEDWPRLRRGRLNTLCVVFVTLVAQLPPGGVLLCMIDGASQYETMALGADMEALMRRLVRLVDSTQDHLVYKLLVTCRTRARGISQYFQDCTLNLDGEAEEADSSSRRIANLRNP
ncbi:hypothetical protein PG993_011398 [Apiospora rasikravindrae]|uniref:DUF7708 domain-containing protein n=1 Tax=Apiospora rasikravindrae TaxID=990691 RepID=A0ABR1SE55_9PEZI